MFNGPPSSDLRAQWRNLRGPLTAVPKRTKALLTRDCLLAGDETPGKKPKVHVLQDDARRIEERETDPTQGAGRPRAAVQERRQVHEEAMS